MAPREKNITSEEKSLLLLKNDVIFKMVFGDEKNKSILRAFLTAILDLPPEEYDEISITDPHLRIESPDGKLGILDLFIKTKEGKQIDVEIQVTRTPFMKERITSYTGKMLAVQLKSGDEYKEIKKVIAIVILDYNLVSDSDYFHNKYVLHDPKTGSLFTDVMEIHTLELKKLPDLPEENRKIAEQIYWLSLIKAEREEEIEMLATKVPEIGDAYEVIKRLSQDEEVRLLYESREKAIRDEQARLYGARREGRREGHREGRREGERDKAIEVTRRTLEMGMSVAQAAKIAGLTISEAEEVKEKMTVAKNMLDAGSEVS